ncbi:hypothetical protein P3G55_08305 [Leptospira sp. 96542]|nr:hypothetical protein [Leptospira sp. 96542]
MKKRIFEYITFIICLLGVGCYSYEIRLEENIDEAKVTKLTVPEFESSFSIKKERDLSYLCEPNKIVYIKFFRTTAKEVWCKPKE